MIIIPFEWDLSCHYTMMCDKEHLLIHETMRYSNRMYNDGVYNTSTGNPNLVS